MKKFYKNKKIGILVVTLLIILVTSAGIYYFNLDRFTNDSRQQETSSGYSDENKDSLSSKTQTANTSVDTTKNTSEVPISKETKITINKLYQDGSSVIYGATISNAGSKGTCSALFENSNSQPVTSITEVTGGSCGPISVPVSRFVSVGKWNLTLRYYSDNMQAVATNSLEVK